MAPSGGLPHLAGASELERWADTRCRPTSRSSCAGSCEPRLTRFNVSRCVAATGSV